MKKPSSKWVEFCRIIKIVDIRIQKVDKAIIKTKRKIVSLNQLVEEKWGVITLKQQELSFLKIRDEYNSLTRLFQRREYIKSCIESLVFDVAVLNKDIENVNVELAELVNSKRKLEKRKEALEEVKGGSIE
ncbi:hypothetical protein [Shewanella waksmanii]|uniref:hypothetical protein n=1 Tax=Shewanella waksmanii TaxID=213783 RepID=UPI003735769E